MRIDIKTMKDITEALLTSAYIACDVKEDHENDSDQRTYEYFRGKEDAYRKAIEIVKVIGS